MYGVASHGGAQRQSGKSESGPFRRVVCWDVAWLVTRQTFSATLAGTAAGTAGGAFLARLLASQFYGVAPRDPGIYLAVLTLIILVAACAAVNSSDDCRAHRSRYPRYTPEYLCVAAAHAPLYSKAALRSPDRQGGVAVKNV